MTSGLEFDPLAHRYTIGDRVFPSVTQITGTIAPIVGVSREVLESKADLGRAVHLATQYYDEGDLNADELPDVVRHYLAAYIKFLSETGFIPERIEQQVCNELYGYAGTYDRIGLFEHLKGVKTTDDSLIDLKATYRIAPIYGPQTALYARAAPYKKLRRFALQLKPDGTYKLQEFTDPSDLSVGLAALTLMNWKERHGH